LVRDPNLPAHTQKWTAGSKHRLRVMAVMLILGRNACVESEGTQAVSLA